MKVGIGFEFVTVVLRCWNQKPTASSATVLDYVALRTQREDCDRKFGIDRKQN